VVADADNLRLLLVEHLLIVGVGVLGAVALSRGPDLVSLIGAEDDFHVVERLPEDVEPVAGVSLPVRPTTARRYLRAMGIAAESRSRSVARFREGTSRPIAPGAGGVAPEWGHQAC
jgi:hypothetical protein